ncbi:MAG: SDR family NAD(P)-dependent oxidoreductase, partial [Pseudomonadota bacterium]
MTESSANWTVITGSTGGIGSEITKILAAKGTDLILVNRSATKAAAQRDELLNQHPSLRIETLTADLMDTAQINAATEEIAALPGRIDALYNNSGVLTADRTLSAQGFESQFAVNTLAPYQLIKNLRPKMVRD